MMMKKPYIKPWLIACFSFLINACSSTPTAHTFTIELDHDAYVFQGNKTEVLHKKGDTISLDGRNSIRIEAPGYMGLLIPPQHEMPHSLKVSLMPFPDFGKDLVDDELNKLLPGVTEILKQITEKRFAEAAAITEELEKKFPRVTTLKFIEASCHLLQGHDGLAETELKSAIKAFPDNKQGKQLYDSLVQDRKLASKTSPKPSKRRRKQ